MKVSELRTICDALARFATIRDKASDVTTRIGVQVGAGRLKLIAGDGVSGIVIDVDQHDGRFAYYIEARPLFQGAKVLAAKDNITIGATEKGLVITAEAGGKLTLNAQGPLSIAGFAKKPNDFLNSVSEITPELFTQMSKLFPAVTRGEEKLSQMYGTLDFTEMGTYITFVEPRVRTKYASMKILTKYDGDHVSTYSVDGGFFEALKAVGHGDIFASVNGVEARGHNTTVYSQSMKVEHWPILAVQGELNSFHMPRKKLIDILKGQVPEDEGRSRVVLSWDKDSLEVRPYGGEGGQEFPVKTIGHGTRGVSAVLLLDMLGGMDDAKDVTVCIAEAAPALILRAEEYKDWTLMLAPIVQ